MANSNDNRPRQSSAALGIRAVVLLYVLYLIYGIVAAYVRGDSDALSLPLTILVSVLLGAVTLVLLALTYRQWKAQSDEPKDIDASEDTEQDRL